jgi:hypothetical protein
LNEAAKRDALRFLKGFHKNLVASLPPANEIEPLIRQTVKEAKPDHCRRHLRLPEAAFLNSFVLPALTNALRDDGLDREDACRALLNEYHPSMRDISLDGPARTVRHPFTKVLGGGASAIYSRWAQGSAALTQSCPDFALREPCRHKIVFEGKYYSNGSLTYAQKELVSDIYQAFFYRGLPFVAETRRGRAAWDYDYACLLAYDASRGGTLKSAWEALPQTVQDSFWDGANIYVMILGGQGRH